MKPPLFIYGHLGLGDHLITNGLVRVKAREHEAVFIPCHGYNFPSVNFMWSDLKNVHATPVDGNGGAEDAYDGFSGDRLRLGMFGEGFSYKDWDKKFYEQAGVPFEARWSEFVLPQSYEAMQGDYFFWHDDRYRKFVIDRARVPTGDSIFPIKSVTIFDWVPDILGANEIHCIDSCFAILADSLPNLVAKRLVIHLYARPGAKPPNYKKNWEILT